MDVRITVVTCITSHAWTISNDCLIKP